MSLDEYQRRVRDKISERRDMVLEGLHRYRYRPSSLVTGADNSILGSAAASSAEEAAFFLVEHTALINAHSWALAVMAEVYKEMTNPDQPPPETSASAEQKAKGAY